MQTNQSELLLVDKIKAGDYDAFRCLYECYFQFLCNYAAKFVKDGFISEDVVQEVFVKIWENRKHFIVNTSVRSYLCSAVRNRSLNRLESESARQKYTSRFFNSKSNLVDSDELEQEEFRNHLFDCIEKLPLRCKEAFVQSRFDKLKQERIALNLNISHATVKTQIHKALKLIRDCLRFSYPEYF
ncbi:MAG: RNA polymerase sigma-70 factor [Prolixibacteraceae bacterium]